MRAEEEILAALDRVNDFASKALSPDNEYMITELRFQEDVVEGEETLILTLRKIQPEDDEENDLFGGFNHD
jgi:hypothetical protein